MTLVSAFIQAEDFLMVYFKRDMMALPIDSFVRSTFVDLTVDDNLIVIVQVRRIVC